MSTQIASIQVHGQPNVRVEVPVTVGPLGARRSRGAAQRLLDSFSDCVTESVVDQRVDEVTDLDGKGRYFVALFEYDRAVRA